MSLELLSPLYNFHGHLNTQSFGNTLDITFLGMCVITAHQIPAIPYWFLVTSVFGVEYD